MNNSLKILFLSFMETRYSIFSLQHWYGAHAIITSYWFLFFKLSRFSQSKFWVHTMGWNFSERTLNSNFHKKYVLKNKKSRCSWKLLIFPPITGQLSISCPVTFLVEKQGIIWTCVFIEEIYMYQEIIPTHCGSLSILVSLYLGSFTAILLRFWPFNQSQSFCHILL